MCVLCGRVNVSVHWRVSVCVHLLLLCVLLLCACVCSGVCARVCVLPCAFASVCACVVACVFVPCARVSVRLFVV